MLRWVTRAVSLCLAVSRASAVDRGNSWSRADVSIYIYIFLLAGHTLFEFQFPSILDQGSKLYQCFFLDLAQLSL